MPNVTFPVLLYKRSNVLPANWLLGMDVKLVRHIAREGTYRDLTQIPTRTPLKRAFTANITPGQEYSLVLTRKDGMHLFRSGTFFIQPWHLNARSQFPQAICYSVEKQVPIREFTDVFELPLHYEPGDGDALRIDTAELTGRGAELRIEGKGKAKLFNTWHDLKYEADFSVHGADAINAHERGPWPFLRVRISRFDYTFNNPLVGIAGFLDRLSNEGRVKALFEQLIARQIERGVFNYLLDDPDFSNVLRLPLALSTLRQGRDNAHLALSVGAMIHPAFTRVDLAKIGPRSR